jgi:colicin import membrane protein
LFFNYLLDIIDAQSIKRSFTVRPAEFTPEEIIEAGYELQAAGRNITGFALRQKVGGGNPNRLKQVWDEHVTSKSTTQTEPVAELPVEVAEEVAAVTKALTERIGQLAIELNDKAVKAAERRVTEVVRAAGEQREQAERELADAAQTVDDLEIKLDETKAELSALTQRLAESQAQAHAQAVEIAQLRERLTAAEKSARDASEQNAAELRRLTAALEAERSGRSDAETEAKRQTELAIRASAERDAASAEVERLREALTAEKERQTTTEQRAGQLEIENGRLTERSAADKEHITELVSQVQRLQGELVALAKTSGGKTRTKTQQ